MRLPDGSGGVFAMRARDAGEMVPRKGDMQRKKCLVASAAHAAARDGVSGVSADRVLAQLAAGAEASALGAAAPPSATGTVWSVHEAYHNLTQSVPHDLTTVGFKSFLPSCLSGQALRTIDVSPDSLLGLRSHRFGVYADTPVHFGILLEQAPSSAFRLYNHGDATEFCDEVSTAAGWAAWACRLSRIAGVSTDGTFCRGFHDQGRKRVPRGVASNQRRRAGASRLKATRRFVGEAAFHHLIHTARHCFNTWYQGPMTRRVETPLSSAREHSKQYQEKVWKLTMSDKTFVFTNSVAAGFEITSSPIGAVAMALNSGLKTLKMRFFHHLSKRG